LVVSFAGLVAMVDVASAKIAKSCVLRWSTSKLFKQFCDDKLDGYSDVN
jgi:hypothetical protein